MRNKFILSAHNFCANCANYTVSLTLRKITVHMFLADLKNHIQISRIFFAKKRNILKFLKYLATRNKSVIREKLQ
jgi:hypothetical protein